MVKSLGELLSSARAAGAMARPSTPPPATESSTLSVSNCRSIRILVGAQRGPHGEFALQSQQPRQQQVGDVGEAISRTNRTPSSTRNMVRRAA